MSYETFSKYYDEVMGKPKERIRLIKQLIKKHNPEAKSILELACGTAEVLKAFSSRYEVWGLDISSSMLEVARDKIKGGRFIEADMSDFDLNRKFDVVFCVFDSINHLLKFEDWESTFKNAYKHLNKGGIFIMDYNPLEKLEKLTVDTRCKLHEVNEDFVVIKVEGWERGAKWKIRFFQHMKGREYKLKEESVKEVSFPLEKIIEALSEFFNEVKVMDEKGIHPPKSKDRIYFLCKKES